MQVTIPTTIAAILPLVTTALSAFLNDDGFAPGINALIALIAILATATACELLAIGLIPGNPAGTALAIAGYVSVLMANDFSVLYVYLIGKPGPLMRTMPPVNATPVITHGAKAAGPQPITLPQPPGGTTPDQGK